MLTAVFQASMRCCAELSKSPWPKPSDTLLLRVADEAMEKLSVLDEDSLAEVAEELAATAEFEEGGWDADQVNELLLEIANLARLAESQGQVLFIWMQPLERMRTED